MTRTPVPPTRVYFDVSALPDVAFGSRDLVWWGTLGFVVIEGFTLALCAVVWIYLAGNNVSWPPPGTQLPSLGVPTALVVLMLLSILLMQRLIRAAHAHDVGRVRVITTIASAVCLAFITLRLIELTSSLHVRWDTNAYGSAQWLVLGVHGTLLIMQGIEMCGIAIAFWFGNIEEKHFSDASDAGFYWYFMVAAWIPLYVLCFLVPRFP